ncbi:MAG: hypothetical protein C0501_15790 [Isosphaera sp.]|nr:hypothetical protein [Isosphaera sp.]
MGRLRVARPCGRLLPAAGPALGFLFILVDGPRVWYTPGMNTVPPDADGDPVVLTSFGSPLGPLVAGATAGGVCLLAFADDPPAGPGRPGTNAHLEQLRAELADYFAGRLRSFAVPLVYPGTAFQRRVWEELLRIPYGETRSYQDVAAAVGDPTAVRAVGRANGSNRVAVVIPCHRVVNKNGDLGGYGGGLRRKQYLLDLERAGAEGAVTPRRDPAASRDREGAAHATRSLAVAARQHGGRFRRVPPCVAATRRPRRPPGRPARRPPPPSSPPAAAPSRSSRPAA